MLDINDKDILQYTIDLALDTSLTKTKILDEILDIFD